MLELEKIQEVLHRDYFEGPQVLHGYIPCNVAGGGTANYKGGSRPERYIPMGISGVTIATGVDLGQTSAGELGNMGVSRDLIGKLKPYLGVRKIDAVFALYRKPLTITRDEADELDRAMQYHHACIISARYDRDAGGGAFESLPWQAQAVIFSILYQRGCGSPRKFPNTWDALVKQDWQDASQRLQNSSLWNGYQNRRKAEGKILAELL